LAPDHPRFDVLGVVGEGGYGTVFEAYDRERGERVAIKQLHRTTPRALAAFKREFRTLLSLVHPGLPRLHELFVHRGATFFSMELVGGEDLRMFGAPAGTLLRSMSATQTDGPPCPGLSLAQVAAPASFIGAESARRVLLVLDALFDVLGFVHKSGLVHCDVKPSNVRVTNEGRVVLLDFGLARPLSEATGSFVGTFAYAAPEQITGTVTPAVDLYALGALAYELLTGEPPFGYGRDAAENKQRRDAPQLPVSSASKEQAALAELVAGLLHRNPEQRTLAVLHYRRGQPQAVAQVEQVVGRDQVIDQIMGALPSVRTGACAVFSLEGPSGMGKSAVLRELHRRLRAAAPELAVLRGRAAEGEHVPWNLFDGVADGLAAAWPSTGCTVATALARAFPVLEGHPSSSERPSAERELSDALRGLVASLGPTVLLLDDVQWADADSRRLLGSLLAPPSPPVLVVLACRSAECVAASQLLQHVERIALQPLSLEHTRKLLRARGAEHNVDAIARESLGHPLFVEELLRAGPDRLGQSLDEVLRGRVARLEGLPALVVQILAFATEPLSAKAVAALVSRDLGETTQTLDLLCKQRCARYADDARSVRYAPFHDRLSELVRAGVGTAAARSLHEAFVGWYLEGDGAAESLCHHLQGAGRNEEAARYARMSADRAGNAMAFEREAFFCQRALLLAPGAAAHNRQLRLRRANALRKARMSVAAADAFLEIARDDVPEQARLLRTTAARLYLAAGKLDRGQAILAELLHPYGDALPRSYREAILALLKERAMLKIELALPAALRGPAQPERLPALRAIAEGLGMIDTLKASVFHTRAVRVALRSSDDAVRAELLCVEAIFVGNAHRKGRRASERLLQRAVSAFGSKVPPRIAAFVNGAHAMNERSQRPSHANLERFKKVEAFFETLGEGDAWVLWSLRLSRARGARILGDLNEMRAFYYRAIAEAEQQQDAYARVTLQRAHTPLLLAADEPERALRVLDQTHWPSLKGAYHIQDWLDLEARLEVALYQGRQLRLSSREWRRLWNSPLHHGDTQRSVHLYMRGRLLLLRPDTPVENLRTGIEVHRTVRRLAAQREGYALGMARALCAGLAARDKDWERAEVELRAVCRIARRYEQLSLEANAWFLRSRLTSGPESIEALSRAQRFYDAHSVRRPEAWARIDFPSFAALLY
jgi:eukaryotic-like serine/threonine-protein kinase